MENIKVNIARNGITTLATAGKYCAANVDVVVSVPEAEDGQLAAQQALEDAVVQGTVQRYTNDRITQIRDYAFQFQSNLVSASCPSVRQVNIFSFLHCDKLAQVDMPALEYVGDSAFAQCAQLTTLDLPSAEGIDLEAFKGCANLSVLILRSPEVCYLIHHSAFTDTPIASGVGFIYVPDALVEQYKVAESWSVYAGKIRPISQLDT